MVSIAVQREVNGNVVGHRADVLGAKTVFCLAGNRVFRIEPVDRGKMADIPLQKSKSGFTSADVLDYLREEKC